MLLNGKVRIQTPSAAFTDICHARRPFLLSASHYPVCDLPCGPKRPVLSAASSVFIAFLLCSPAAAQWTLSCGPDSDYLLPPGDTAPPCLPSSSMHCCSCTLATEAVLWASCCPRGGLHQLPVHQPEMPSAGDNPLEKYSRPLPDFLAMADRTVFERRMKAYTCYFQAYTGVSAASSSGQGS